MPCKRNDSLSLKLQKHTMHGLESILIVQKGLPGAFDARESSPRLPLEAIKQFPPPISKHNCSVSSLTGLLGTSTEDLYHDDGCNKSK